MMTMCRRFLIPLLLLSVTSAVVEVEGAQVILYTNDLLMMQQNGGRRKHLCVLPKKVAFLV